MSLFHAFWTVSSHKDSETSFGYGSFLQQASSVYTLLPPSALALPLNQFKTIIVDNGGLGGIKTHSSRCFRLIHLHVAAIL